MATSISSVELGKNQNGIDLSNVTNNNSSVTREYELMIET